MVTTVAPIFFIFVTDFLFGRSERLSFQISHTGPIFTLKLHFLKMPSFFVEVESWPKCPQLAIYSSRQSSTSHSIEHYKLCESLFEIAETRSASIVFQRWLRKFHFQYLIFLIFLRFGAEFCKFSNFESSSYFELGIFKN